MTVDFTSSAYEDYQWWQKHDPKKIVRITKLCKAIAQKPFEGIGKPEPLKFGLQGCWSRRIDTTHRLVYTVQKNKITVISCRYHY
jgi:toxin YoeB